MEGVYIASKNKKGYHSHTYYVRNDLANLAYLFLKTHQNDEEFIKWNKERLERKRM